MSDELRGIDFSDWRALTPAQRRALTIALTRRARAARSRAIGKALQTAIGRLLGRPKGLPVPAAAPVSMRS